MGFAEAGLKDPAPYLAETSGNPLAKHQGEQSAATGRE
jgi:hypothetical protein